LNGKGASLLDGYMEDLATDRIYRLMIAQRTIEQVRKRGLPPQLGERGQATLPDLFLSSMFDEELDRILSELPSRTDDSIIEKYRTARHISEFLIRNQEFDPI